MAVHGPGGKRHGPEKPLLFSSFLKGNTVHMDNGFISSSGNAPALNIVSVNRFKSLNSDEVLYDRDSTPGHYTSS